MRAAAVQLNSTQEKDRNLERADRLTRAAAADGAGLIVLPEKFNLLGEREHYLSGAEPLDGPTVAWAKETARELGVELVAGSFVERRSGRDKLSNTCVHVGPDGELKAVYRKIHMFDVVVGGVEYRESESEEAGDEIVLSRTADGVPLGLTVCYDLRFPELYRILALEGARVMTIPSAFTRVTGQAHWEVLVRARAIENQAFVVAAGQVGPHPGGKESFGGSLIVDPWGHVLARAADCSAHPPAEGSVAAELDLEAQEDVRRQLPSLANRVPGAYRWPQKDQTADPTRLTQPERV
jgi:deaminated glutathione amidase